MGLFDKRDKKRGGDDFDSPVESVDLDKASAPKGETWSEPSLAAPAAAAQAASAAKPAPTPALPSPDSDSYGIDKAIELMRTLPQENIQLVVQVVKFSLESVGIRLPIIIDDAIRRQKDLRGRVDVLKSEIADLEQEITQRKAEIEKHETDYRETTTVRERLELAEGIAKPTAVESAPAPPTLPGATRATGSNPSVALPPLGASAPKK